MRRKSTRPRSTAKMTVVIRTIFVEERIVALLGQATFFILFSQTEVSTGQEGFEPPTPGFGDQCSNRWSYWPIYLYT